VCGKAVFFILFKALVAASYGIILRYISHVKKEKKSSSFKQAAPAILQWVMAIVSSVS